MNFLAHARLAQCSPVLTCLKHVLALGLQGQECFF